ncbi:related to integral membrane transporter or flippase that may transport LCBs from the cytoplasmic side toward the extracytoplasmic side of the membrane [Serendipita indica DSM 11827]|uniref:Related to integral membrane transporter or flippase that may transport LCBs from the cytoplasmic side toward the extracytoplasmic side of the membrane n=1 Tax=Serendipita indica (strain DSM 11827) TaxID=1109443 RepID=G4U2S5_SERID|nr:related to integral membrane transporter or flippase that may transport LCBs from the cytoplasmic side toward the extracytoplasmic side of the membrane [Serendipita indica DSM 11827]
MSTNSTEMGGAGSIPGLPVHATLYGYVPTKWVCALMIALFGLSMLLHIGQAVKFRIWWLFPTIILGTLSEVIGWGGRLWSSSEPRMLNPYLMQITTTILGPSFMTAANFTILGIIIRLLGPQYSWLSPRMYLIIFLTFDLIALVGQAVGGAKASLAAETGQDPTPGGNIMCYFIIVQMAAISLYTICASEFLLRYHFNKPVRRVKPFIETPSEQDETASDGVGSRTMDRGIILQLVGMGISTVFILIRSVYRTIELLDGWTGRIITTQLYFNVLDGACIVIAVYAINIFHPGWLLSDHARTMGRKPKPTVFEGDAEKTQDT